MFKHKSSTSSSIKYDRCGHSINGTKTKEMMKNHANAFRFAAAITKYPVNLKKENIKINIPIIFHLVDPFLADKPLDIWKKHINDNIVTTLNIDYNRNYDNFANTLNEFTRKLFDKADYVKKKYYRNLSSILPKNINVKWNFFLEDVFSIPSHDPQINNIFPDSNEKLFRHVSVCDPDSKLNIIIINSGQILGMSIFPFCDRDSNNAKKIDTQYKYRHAVLIATQIFLGNNPPYDQYKTFTHEIGHWCGLLHPFDDAVASPEEIVKYGLDRLIIDSEENLMHGGTMENMKGDLIADTMPQTDPTYGTVYDEFKITSLLSSLFCYSSRCKKQRKTPYAWIFEDNEKFANFLNFMDYTDDKQLMMFTHDQMLKMIYIMITFRSGFIIE